jgi:protein kinase domain-containing protein
MKLMKEVLLHTHLTHSNLVRMLGYCVRSEETNAMSLKEHGVVGVYEYAPQASSSRLRLLSLPDRLLSAWELLDLLAYLEHSSLGSVLLADLKRTHLLFRPPRSVVITDLDDANAVEPTCSDAMPRCAWNVPCVDGKCIGSNAKHNLKQMHELVLSRLLSCSHDVMQDKTLGLHKGIRIEVDVVESVRMLCSRLQAADISAQNAATLLLDIIHKLRINYRRQS